MKNKLNLSNRIFLLVIFICLIFPAKILQASKTLPVEKSAEVIEEKLDNNTFIRHPLISETSLKIVCLFMTVSYSYKNHSQTTLV